MTGIEARLCKALQGLRRGRRRVVVAGISGSGGGSGHRGLMIVGLLMVRRHRRPAMAGADRMTIGAVVRKVLLKDHADRARVGASGRPAADGVRAVGADRRRERRRGGSCDASGISPRSQGLRRPHESTASARACARPRTCASLRPSAKNVGEPYAGKLHARFDVGGGRKPGPVGYAARSRRVPPTLP